MGKSIDRREFAVLLPALLACSAVVPEVAPAQTNLPVIESGYFRLRHQSQAA